METLLKIWPSIAALAEDLQRPYPTVQSWGHRKRIPPAIFPDLLVAAEKRGATLTYQELVAANAAMAADMSPSQTQGDAA